MSQSTKIEFGIAEVKSVGSKAVIDGRCHGGPIKTGDIFTTVSEMTVPITSQGYGPPRYHPVASVEIKVDSIWAYGREIGMLSQSMTAQLALTGTGLEHLKVDLVLS